MAFARSWTDPQPAGDGRGLTGEQGAGPGCEGAWPISGLEYI